MGTIAEKALEALDSKNAIKKVLTNKGLSPSDDFSTYAALIDTLSAEGQTVYMLQTEAGDTAYAQLANQEKVALTATANDIRLGTTAFTDSGVTEGEKDIPSYHTRKGTAAIRANADFKIKISGLLGCRPENVFLFFA